MATEDPTDRLDVVLYGATGFVGRLTARYLAQSAPESVRVGLAGRSQERLAAVRDELGPRASGWPLIVADSNDPGSMDALAASARVVATTVGPYARYGLPLVEACARAGTDYADLTGEVLFVRQCIDRVHDTAVDSGARIVNACGFDSIPSDLAVLGAAERARADGEGELAETTLLVRRMKGGLSGGTIDSARAQAEAIGADSSLREVVGDPYALSPDRAAEPDPGDGGDSMLVTRDGDLGVWTGPFIMAPFNTRIVRRSNALQGWAYGRGFRYREVMNFGSGLTSPALAVGTAAGLAATYAGMAFGPTRKVLDRFAPSPGEGPSEEARRKGHFTMEVHATTTTGARYVSVVAAQGDPGYAATSVMLGESALCLALDGDRTPQRSGVLTPATAMGSALVERLRAAGFTLTVDRA
jgi:short subunit dehydrogenase-like uncharacterized protein